MIVKPYPHIMVDQILVNQWKSFKSTGWSSVAGNEKLSTVYSSQCGVCTSSAAKFFLILTWVKISHYSWNDGYSGCQHVSILTLWVLMVQFLFKAQGGRSVLFAEHMMEIWSKSSSVWSFWSGGDRLWWRPWRPGKWPSFVWRFPEIGVPVIIHFRLGLSMK